MTLENIETFLVLAKTQNFSRTAEMMFVAQSTVTNRIKQLESELNRALFIRTAKTVTMTDAGLCFLQYAQSISKLTQESVDALRCYQSFDQTVSVCATDAIWRYFLLSFFTAFVSENPQTAFKLYTQDSRETSQLVIAGKIDLGASLLDVFHPEVERIPFFEDRYCLVAAPGLVPAGTTITPDNLRKYPYIHANWSNDFNEWYDKNYHYRNYHLEIGHTTHIGSWVRSGLGVAFFPYCAVKSLLDSGELVSIPYEQGNIVPLYTGYLLYMKRNQDKLGELVNRIIQHVQSLNDTADG